MPIVVVLVLAIAYWLSGGFSVQFFGVHLSGLVWGIIGAEIGGVFALAKWGDKLE